MSKLPMKRVGIYGLKNHRKAILEALQRYGVLEPISEDFSELGFDKMNTVKSSAAFMKARDTLEQALEIIDKLAPEKKPLFAFLEGKRMMTAAQYYDTVENADSAVAIAAEISALFKRSHELEAEGVRLEGVAAGLKPWIGLDMPMSFKGTRKASALIGSLPDEYTEADIPGFISGAAAELGTAAAVDVNIISSEPGVTNICVLCLRKSAPVIEAALRTRGFSRPQYVSELKPAEEILVIQKKIAEGKREAAQNISRIKTLAKHRDLLRFMADYYTMRIDKYKTLGDLNQRRRFFVVSGYVPEMYCGALSEELIQRYGAAVEISDISEEEQAPVLLRNNAFSQPVESVLETYSMPAKNEVDPTFIMSLFYYFLFGIMLSDAGYGLLMIVGCAFVLLRYNNMDHGLRRTLKMFFYCGISTFVWGLLFGGFFGDAVTVISSTFFGSTVSMPALWFEPIRDPMRMLVFSFAVGIVHLFAGLGIRFYQLVKAGDIRGAVYDVVFWYLLVGGGIVYLMSMQTFVDMTGLSFRLPAAAGTAAAVCAGIGALGIVAFGGRTSKNPGKRIAKGLYELYGVTGYLSDILSYSRLLALGLATGVIAQVFNQMGSMMGGGVFGAVFFTLVFVIGHALNMAINLLGAYVHTNRLQFVEFFGKFYEGGGEKFSPFSPNTKYFKFKEEK